MKSVNDRDSPNNNYSDSKNTFRSDNENLVKTMNLFQPKLLKIKKLNQTSNIINGKDLINEAYYEECKKIKKNLNEKNRKAKKTENLILEEKSMSKKYYKNLTQILMQRINENDSSDGNKILLKEIKGLNLKMKHDIIQNIENHSNLIREEIEIEKSQNQNKVNRISTRSNIKNEINEPQEINSEPINDLNIIEILSENDNKSKFGSIFNTRSDVKASILNNKLTSLNQENLIKKTLDCLKGEQIELPNRKFLKINELSINDINTNEMQFTKNLLNVQKQFEEFKNNLDHTLVEQIEKTIQKENQIYNILMEKTNNSINSMEEKNKISDEMLSMIKHKLNEEFQRDVIELGIKQLSICDLNLDNQKKELDVIFNNEQNIAKNIERINFIEDNNRKTEEMINKFLKDKEINYDRDEVKCENELSEKTINKLYNRFKPKKKINKFENNPIGKNFIRNKMIIRPTTKLRF